MEKKWVVECWGDIGVTDISYTRTEAKEYFDKIKEGLNKRGYTFTKDSTVEIQKQENAVYITKLKTHRKRMAH